MSAVAARPLLRSSAFRTLPSRMIARFESTTTQKATGTAKDAAAKASETASSFQAKATETAKDAAGKASETASSYQAKAAEGLTRVTSAAGPAIAGAAKGVGNALGRIGGRTGRFIGFVERQVPFVIYYSRVGLELSKIVFRGQKMAPPPVATFRSYFQNTWQIVKHPGQLFNTASKTAADAASTAAAQPSSVLQQIRNINTATAVAGGVVLAECLGFFTVGEMIGRFKIVGYHGESEAAHH